jgi:hypothetical protein
VLGPGKILAPEGRSNFMISFVTVPGKVFTVSL